MTLALGKASEFVIHSGGVPREWQNDVRKDTVSERHQNSNREDELEA